MNFSRGHSGTNRACFPRKTPEFTEMGEIHELFVLALSLVWFGGATPEAKPAFENTNRHLKGQNWHLEGQNRRLEENKCRK